MKLLLSLVTHAAGVQTYGSAALRMAMQHQELDSAAEIPRIRNALGDFLEEHESTSKNNESIQSIRFCVMCEGITTGFFRAIEESNLDALRLFVESPLDIVHELDLYGRSSIEAAAENENLDAVNFLMPFYLNTIGRSLRIQLPNREFYEVINIPYGTRDHFTFGHVRQELAHRFPGNEFCRLFVEQAVTGIQYLVFDDELVMGYPLLLESNSDMMVAKLGWEESDVGDNTVTFDIYAGNDEALNLSDFLTAARMGDGEVLDSFFDDHHIDPNQMVESTFFVDDRPYYTGTTALLEGIHRPDIVRRLLEVGADPNLPAHGSPLRPYPLQQAVRYGAIGSVRYLLEAGADSVVPGILHSALRHGREMVTLLLRWGSDPNSLPARMTPIARELSDPLLHRAVLHDDSMLVQDILDYGGEPCAINNIGETALDVAHRRLTYLEVTSQGMVDLHMQRKLMGCRDVIATIEATECPEYIFKRIIA